MVHLAFVVQKEIWVIKEYVETEDIREWRDFKGRREILEETGSKEMKDHQVAFSSSKSR